MAGFIEKNTRSITEFLEQAIFIERKDEKKKLSGSINPTAKLILLVIFITTVSLVKNLTILAFATLLPIIIAILAGIKILTFVKRVFIFIPLYTVIIATPAIFIIEGKTIFSIGPLSVTYEGVRAAGFLVLRVSASISATMLFIMTTRWNELLKSLEALRIPEGLIAIIALSYRYIHLLLKTLLELLTSRKSRVIGKLPFRENLKIFSHSIAFIFIKTLYVAEGVQMAMESRGYNIYGQLPSSIDSRAGEAKINHNNDNHIFTLHDIKYNYPGGIKGVEIADLSIEKGKCTVLLGANGSGKSTLLKLLDALIFPQKGELLFMGRKLAEKLFEDKSFQYFFRRSVGFIFQDPDIHCFSPTVEEELAFGPAQLGLTDEEISKRIDRALQMLKIEELRKRYPYNLSGGEKKRVAIASILTVDPEVYLMDEPAEGLDPEVEGILIDLISELLQRGKTVVVATQDLTLARHIGDKAIILNENKSIAKYGSAEELLNDMEILKRTHLIHFHRVPHKKGRKELYHTHYREE